MKTIPDHEIHETHRPVPTQFCRAARKRAGKVTAGSRDPIASSLRAAATLLSGSSFSFFTVFSTDELRKRLKFLLIMKRNN